MARILVRMTQDFEPEERWRVNLPSYAIVGHPDEMPDWAIVDVPDEDFPASVQSSGSFLWVDKKRVACSIPLHKEQPQWESVIRSRYAENWHSWQAESVM